jgi:hypothetical protein
MDSQVHLRLRIRTRLRQALGLVDEYGALRVSLTCRRVRHARLRKRVRLQVRLRLRVASLRGLKRSMARDAAEASSPAPAGDADLLVRKRGRVAWHTE